ncbi:MAG: hypothetical protein WCG84_01095 [Candidatus Moraniibacteriota bacterium]
MNMNWNMSATEWLIMALLFGVIFFGFILPEGVFTFKRRRRNKEALLELRGFLKRALLVLDGWALETLDDVSRLEKFRRRTIYKGWEAFRKDSPLEVGKSLPETMKVSSWAHFYEDWEKTNKSNVVFGVNQKSLNYWQKQIDSYGGFGGELLQNYYVKEMSREYLVAVNELEQWLQEIEAAV